jgi:hypothetical protein
MPWLAQLYYAILEFYPLPPGLQVLEDKDIPPPRVSMSKPSSSAKYYTLDPLEVDPKYHSATVRCNSRLTADEWYQDVRHIELSLDHEVK